MTSLQLREIVRAELAHIGKMPDVLRGRPRRTVFASDLPGFGFREYASGRKVWIVQARMGGELRTVTIGSAAVINERLAKNVARRVLLRAQVGENPANTRAKRRSCPTWRAFVEEFWQRCSGQWKPSTRHTDLGRRTLYLDTAFPGLHIDEINEEMVTRWFAALSRRAPGNANRTLAILSAILNKAEEWGYRDEHSNPCGSVRRNRSRKGQRFLADQELARLGKAFRDAEAREPLKVAALRLILLTGCRKLEIVNLKWREVRGMRLLLEDSKTGVKTVWLGEAARAVLDTIPRKRSAEHVFEIAGKTREAWLTWFWHRMRDEIGLPGVRIHDLRHSFASKGLRSSETLPVIGKLLGHARIDTTARYAHLDDYSCLEASESIGAIISDLLSGRVR